jgi:hypothetical protein
VFLSGVFFGFYRGFPRVSGFLGSFRFFFQVSSFLSPFRVFFEFRMHLCGKNETCTRIWFSAGQVRVQPVDAKVNSNPHTSGLKLTGDLKPGSKLSSLPLSWWVAFSWNGLHLNRRKIDEVSGGGKSGGRLLGTKTKTRLPRRASGLWSKT